MRISGQTSLARTTTGEKGAWNLSPLRPFTCRIKGGNQKKEDVPIRRHARRHRLDQPHHLHPLRNTPQRPRSSLPGFNFPRTFSHSDRTTADRWFRERGVFMSAIILALRSLSPLTVCLRVLRAAAPTRTTTRDTLGPSRGHLRDPNGTLGDPIGTRSGPGRDPVFSAAPHALPHTNPPRNQHLHQSASPPPPPNVSFSVRRSAQPSARFLHMCPSSLTCPPPTRPNPLGSQHLRLTRAQLFLQPGLHSGVEWQRLAQVALLHLLRTRT